MYNYSKPYLFKPFMNLKIIARKKEQKRLDAAFNSPEAEFIAVYGRRRVGKTFLIKEFFTNKECLFFHTTGIKNAKAAEQLKRFSKNIGETFYNNAPVTVEKNWLDAFEQLTQAINQQSPDQKCILFLDELPWLATHKSGLIQALDYYWNRYWVSDERIKLIICGSSASWIIRKVLKDRGGLHNRVTERMRIMPFNLSETNEFLANKNITLNTKQCYELYRCIGGVPFYLSYIQRGISIENIIETLFFEQEGKLLEEFDELFDSLFTASNTYKELIEIIANKQSGILRTEIASVIKQSDPGNQLTERLNNLENAGFIQGYLPLDATKKGYLYKLTDEFCYFYLKWVKTVVKQVKTNSISNYWSSSINTPAYFNWAGYTFENYCIKNILLLKKLAGASPAAFASPWQQRPHAKITTGTQVDLLVEDGDTAYLFEFKYTKSAFVIDKSYSNVLENKVNVYKEIRGKDKQVLLILVSANGLKENDYSNKLVDKVLCLDDILGSN